MPSKYTPTIGIECHVQLKTKTKLFSAVSNDAREASPNSLISHIDLAMPGALPVLNERAVYLAVKAAFALGVRPQKTSYFERKHYFYPDLPKGYQITQLQKPIIVGGQVNITIDGETKIVHINRVQIEEDAGKSTHPSGKDYSLVDLNRAGTPLLEIVSEPDMHSADEAKAYVRELYLLARYADISDADLYHGNMRFDVNVSISADADKLGTRAEVKNLNSFRSVEKAIEYEIKRQSEILDRGQLVVQETRGWDDAKQKTFSQRSKEESHDYRYFPDPDIPPIVLEEEYTDGIKKEMPILPEEWRNKLSSLNLDISQIEVLLDAEVESDIGYLANIAHHIQDAAFARFLANWYVNVLIPLVNDSKNNLDQDHIKLEKAIYSLITQNKLSSTNAKALYAELASIGQLPPDVDSYADEHGYIQVSDAAEIEAVVSRVLRDNAQAANDVKGGEAKAIGFLVGQVMKSSRGKANPEMAQTAIKKQLGV